MPVDLKHIRDQLYPGLVRLQPLAYSFVQTKEIYAANFLQPTSAAVVSLPVAMAMGAAAAIIANPEMSRRGLWGFLKS